MLVVVVVVMLWMRFLLVVMAVAAFVVMIAVAVAVERCSWKSYFGVHDFSPDALGRLLRRNAQPEPGDRPTLPRAACDVATREGTHPCKCLSTVL